MPVYVSKKRRSLTPATLSEPNSDEEDLFLHDPDQFRDELPQPYRLVGKLVQEFFDVSWQVIEKHKEEAIEEAHRIRPPTAGEPLEVPDISNICVIEDSKDECFLFAGTKYGLIAIDPVTFATIDKWEDPALEIVSMSVALIGVKTYLLSTIDDMGFGNLFAFAGERFYLLKSLNDQEGDKKLILSKLQISCEGDYMACTFENNSVQPSEIWLEVHKLPKDIWLRELDAIVSRLQKDAPPPPPPSAPQNHEDPEAEIEAAAAEEKEEGTQSPAPEDRTSYKFSLPTIVLKARPPGKLTGSTAASLPISIKQIDQGGDVVGFGANHILSGKHLENREQVFNFLHKDNLKFLSNEERPVNCLPEVMFLQCGRAYTLGLGKAEHAGRPTAVAVAWSNTHLILHYSLLKQAKDVEHRADIVWTTDDVICSCALSPCSSLMAVGLKNGNVIIYDSRLGLVRRVACVAKEEIISVDILNPSVCGKTGGRKSISSFGRSTALSDSERKTSNYPPYGTTVRTFVLCVTKSWDCYVLRAGPGEVLPAQLVHSSAKHDPEMPLFVTYPRIHPDLILRVTRAGHVVLQDVLRSTELLDFHLPQPYSTAQPWQPTMTLAANGQALFLRGVREDEDENGDKVETDKLFCFLLKPEEAMNSYWTRQSVELPCFVHNATEERSNSLLTYRLATHGERQSGLQKRWSNLRDTLTAIEQRKEQNKAQQSFVSAGTTVSSRSSQRVEP